MKLRKQNLNLIIKGLFFIFLQKSDLNVILLLFFSFKL